MMEICPFIAGRPLRPAEFRDRSSEVQRLMRRLLTGQATAVIGPPKTGKTSLLNYIQDRSLLRGLVGDRLDRAIFSYIDSQMLGGAFNQAAFWQQALRPLAQQASGGPAADLYQMAADNDFGTFTLEQLFCQFGNGGGQFVLLLDEFDSLLTHGVLNSAEFYGGLRSLCSRCAGFALILASRRSVSLLNDETQKINPHGSPYFNVFTELHLGPLPKGHAQALLMQAKGAFQHRDLEFLLRVSGRHPYLLQLSAAVLWERCHRGRAADDGYREAADEILAQTAAHFADAWNARSVPEKKALTTIALAQIQGQVGAHAFDWRDLLDDLSDYLVEIKVMEKDGTLVRRDDGGWDILPQAYLWWLADDLKRHVRDDAEFGDWLRRHALDGVLSCAERAKIGQAVSVVGNLLSKGATTLIETFVKGLAAGSLKAIGM
jgi:hypothetical protein